MPTLRGTVFTGRGDLAQWMQAYRELYEQVTGVALFPGSLNILLEHDWSLPDSRLRLEPADYGGRIGMNIVPCTISGLAAFIVRTDPTEAGTGDHSKSVIEIAAGVRLRDALGLHDGDVVEVIVSE
jgi:riboflavin kinase, archaea type